MIPKFVKDLEGKTFTVQINDFTCFDSKTPSGYDRGIIKINNIIMYSPMTCSVGENIDCYISTDKFAGNVRIYGNGEIYNRSNRIGNVIEPLPFKQVGNPHGIPSFIIENFNQKLFPVVIKQEAFFHTQSPVIYITGIKQFNFPHKGFKANIECLVLLENEESNECNAFINEDGDIEVGSVTVATIDPRVMPNIKSEIFSPPVEQISETTKIDDLLLTDLPELIGKYENSGDPTIKAVVHILNVLRVSLAFNGVTVEMDKAIIPIAEKLVDKLK